MLAVAVKAIPKRRKGKWGNFFGDPGEYVFNPGEVNDAPSSKSTFS
jgi:hypothetical protein